MGHEHAPRLSSVRLWRTTEGRGSSYRFAGILVSISRYNRLLGLPRISVMLRPDAMDWHCASLNILGIIVHGSKPPL
jgi:hypothetical protein